MERLTLRDDDGRALLTPYGLRIYCSAQATADCICKLEEALKAQEPRLMTLEYFDNSPDKDSKGCLVAWVEYRRDEEWAEYWEGTCDEWSVIRRDDFYSGESYRFWTSAPSDEVRRATPWN